jgi:hypothetical protein
VVVVVVGWRWQLVVVVGYARIGVVVVGVVDAVVVGGGSHLHSLVLLSAVVVAAVVAEMHISMVVDVLGRWWAIVVGWLRLPGLGAMEAQLRRKHWQGLALAKHCPQQGGPPAAYRTSCKPKWL